MKKDKEQKNIFHSTEVIFLIVVTCIVSFIMGLAVSDKMLPHIENNQGNSVTKKIEENYKYIKDNYYGTIDDNKLVNGAIEGMLTSLDDKYSLFINDENFDINLEGNYKGVGITISNDKDGNIVIVAIIKDSPAAKAGLQIGDIVSSTDGKDFLGKDKSELTTYIKENDKDEFIMIVKRNGEEKTVTLKRELVTIPSVTSQMFEEADKKIGYIYFNIFSNTTYSQFETQLNELEKQGMTSLIIDVRENTGGHLTTAVNILSLFLDSKHLIYQTEKKGKITKYYSAGTKTKKYSIVILQNENSASASELLSAALQESYGATVVGMTSYGKGTVQELVTLEDGNEYKFTTKKWLTPNGNWIHEKGVKPNVEVDLDDSYFENPSDVTDNQLQKALSILK